MIKVGKKTDFTINTLMMVKCNKAEKENGNKNLSACYHKVYKDLIRQIQKGEITEEQAIDNAVVIYLMGYEKFCEVIELYNLKEEK